ncbi:MAG: cell division ATP-binding protein FtsE [Alphaproteobacteria bacterium]|nr:cell division ATP-binding protein FtsE [Alphaproteobacteria bacterium]
MSDRMMPEPILKMEDVSMRYGDGPEILSNINLALPRGSFHFLTGKSGAGKTTLLSMMYLAQKPTSGRVSIFGSNVNFTNRSSLAMSRRRIGVVFQDFRLLDHVSAFDNVALPLRVCGMNEKEIGIRVNELLKWVEIKRSTSSLTSTLSGGEKQRVAIARAVINRPDFLLADEPTGNVDSDIATKLMKLFVELNKLGTTVVIATHNENLIREFHYPQIHLHNHGVAIIPAGRIEDVAGI